MEKEIKIEEAAAVEIVAEPELAQVEITENIEETEVTVSELELEEATEAPETSTGHGEVEINPNAKSLSSKYIYDNNGKMAGYWTYGTSGGQIISKFKAYSPYQGRASVENCKSEYNNGGWKSAGTFSTASLPACTLGTDKAFYDYK
ncbi:MAG: hypothetical protein BEN18_11025 [Epulopiscium sp. Nuni2H_MBin001]|nr:MAG: hypothetical protein BEN18_11025 [Epulopiscium sp. Nuni2H_MBin001]